MFNFGDFQRKQHTSGNYNLNFHTKRYRPSDCDSSVFSKPESTSSIELKQSIHEESKESRLRTSSCDESSSNFSEILTHHRQRLQTDYGRAKESIMTKSLLEEVKDDNDYGCIICLTENKAKEVGFAVINLRSLSIELTQISDSQTYVNTLTLLHNYSPIEVVMPSSLQDSALNLRICSNFDSDLIFKYIQRKLFSEEQGIKIFEESCSKSFINIDKKYVAMSCLAGLISYWEMYKSIVLDPRCLVVDFIFENERMTLDFMTIKNLELTFNLKTFNSKSTLASKFITETEAGKHLLRTNLLNPLKNVDKI